MYTTILIDWHEISLEQNSKNLVRNIKPIRLLSFIVVWVCLGESISGQGLPSWTRG